jgi:hypothetical protein
VSPVYELTLLHWEKQLQRDLGKSILNLVTALSAYAAEVSTSQFCRAVRNLQTHGSCWTRKLVVLIWLLCHRLHFGIRF